MKSIIKDFAHVFYALLFLISTKALSQEHYSFTITPELSKQMVEKFQPLAVKIYPVSFKEIDYHGYDTLQVITNSYKILSEELEEYRPAYDLYTSDMTFYSGKQEAIKTIIKNIDYFLSTDDKKEIKDIVMLESQNLADKYKIKVTTVDNRIKLQSFLNTADTRNNTANPPERNVLLYEKGRPANKNDLKIFREDIQKIRLVEPRMTYEYQQYIKYSDRLLETPKTETGKVLSDKISKRSTYMIDENQIDLNTFSGTFIELPEKYVRVGSDYQNKFVKNELIIDNDDYHNGGNRIEKCPIIKKIGTEDLYYVQSTDYVTELSRIQREQELLDIVHKLGYKEYKADGELYIKTKTSRIRLDAYTYSVLKPNPSWITTLDVDQTKLSALIKQTVSHSSTLNKYVMLYNVQRNKMSTANINAWRAATAQAQKLNDQIYKIDEKYAGNYSFMPLEKSDARGTFSDNLGASKGVLGM